MDTITHMLTGAVMSGPAKAKLGWVGPAAILAGSLAPDADMALLAFGREVYFRYHRVVENSVVGVAVFPLVVALVIWLLFKKEADFKIVWLLVLLGYVTHVFMDLTNAYGCPLLWPFSRKWYSLDWVFIVDPWITGLMVLGLILMYFRVRPMPVAAVCFALLIGYWGLKGAMHSNAVAAARAKFPDAERVGAFPAPVNPFRWHIVADGKDSYWMGWTDLVDGSWREGAQLGKPPFIEAAEKAAEAPNARAFLEFARFPLLSYRRLPDGWLVRFKDLRFSRKPDDSRFIATVRLGCDGSIKEDSFEF